PVPCATLFRAADENGRDLVPAPALTAQLPPAVIIGVLATDIEQAIDRGRAAQDLAARQDMLAPARAGIRLGRIEPIDLGVLQGLGIANRDMDHQVGHELRQVAGRAIIAARFEEQDLGATVRRQSIGQHAARRSGAH
ncbi:MAG: hypothetical protein AN485_24065, partial [Anabaena sp. MDT14b]